MARLEYAANELIDTISGYELIDGEPTIGIVARFDEYQCQLIIDCQGERINIPQVRPDPELLLDNPDGVRDMAGYLVKGLANKVSVSASKGRVQLTLLFKE